MDDDALLLTTVPFGNVMMMLPTESITQGWHGPEQMGLATAKEPHPHESPCKRWSDHGSSYRALGRTLPLKGRSLGGMVPWCLQVGPDTLMVGVCLALEVISVRQSCDGAMVAETLSVLFDHVKRVCKSNRKAMPKNVLWSRMACGFM